MIDDGSVLENLVFKNCTVIGLSNAGGFLHHFRSQTNIAANEPPAGCNLSVNPFSLHRIVILHRHIRVSRGQKRDHGAAVCRFIQLLSDYLMLLFAWHPQVSPSVFKRTSPSENPAWACIRGARGLKLVTQLVLALLPLRNFLVVICTSVGGTVCTNRLFQLRRVRALNQRLEIAIEVED